VLSAALTGWLDQLQAEALKRAGSHPVWKQIAHGFDAGLAAQARDRFQLTARRVHQDRLQRPDFRSDMDGHTTNYSGTQSEW